jgi:hypothetical protein
MIRIYSFFRFFLIIASAATIQSPVCAQDFGEEWFGAWKGELTMYSNKNPNHTQATKIQMELNILSTDTIDRYRFVMVYKNGDKTDARDYRLQAIDVAKGYYQMDELNGILIEAYFLGNTLSTFYEVENAILAVNYTLEGDSLFFEVISTDKRTEKLSGNIPEKEIPLVKSYKTVNYQVALLHK